MIFLNKKEPNYTCLELKGVSNLAEEEVKAPEKPSKPLAFSLEPLEQKIKELDDELARNKKEHYDHLRSGRIVASVLRKIVEEKLALLKERALLAKQLRELQQEAVIG